MRLRSQLTLAFAACAVLPILGLTAAARWAISYQRRTEFRQELLRARDEADREFRHAREEVRQKVAQLADDESLIGPLLVKLAAGPLPDEEIMDLNLKVQRAMPALGFDVLALADERGTVLACGHFPGKSGDSDPELLRVARARAGQAQLATETVLADETPKQTLVIEASRTFERRFVDRRARLTVVGGRRLDRLLSRVSAEHVRLVAADGVELASRGGAVPASAPRATFDLERGDGTVGARIEIAIPDADLQRTLFWVSALAAMVAAATLIVAFLVGRTVARRWSRPLERLADGARAVARGQLDTRVGVARNDELGELGEAFDTMTRDLAQAREELVRAERVAAWREIAQRIAHEIKNPLTPIQMAIETLERARAKGPAVFDPLFKESAQTILDEVARLKHIVAEFSSFARMPQPVLKPCAVGEVVEAALKLYAGAVPVERELDPTAPPALADRDQITQVLLNLVENAREAVSQKPEGGRIRVRTRTARAGDRVELEVADDGPGIADEARAKLFTPYFTTKAKGTGLGLAIVHRIVSDHGGEIRVGGAVGSGAIFTIALPLAP